MSTNSNDDSASESVSEAVGANEPEPAPDGKASASSAQEPVNDSPEVSADIVEADTVQNNPAPDADGMVAVTITIGGNIFTARFYDNESSRVLTGQMPMTLQMGDYAGQEKVINLSYDFPSASTERPSTIRAGEIYLWSGNSLVLFYTTFSNSYSGYVPIGYIEDTTGLTAALGSGDASVTFSIP